MIPANLMAPHAVQTLGRYLIDEFRRVRSERLALEQDWTRWQELYRARSPQGKVTFPFVGAANVVVPVAATDVDIYVAQMLGTLFSSRNLWALQHLKPEFAEAAPKIAEFIEAVQDTDLDMYSTVTQWVTETAKLGTGILKVRYVRENKKAYEWREQGGQIFQQQAMRLLKDNPEVSRVALADFYIPASAKNIKEAPWVGERLNLTWGQFEARVREGIYAGIENVERWWLASTLNRGTGYDWQMQRMDRFMPSRPDKVELVEFWLDFDIDGDGLREAIVCTMHEPSQTLLRVDFNPFFDQEKPYESSRFIVVEGRFYGIGLCEMYDAIQDEITAMHRQRIDAGTLQNSQAYKAKRGSVRTDVEIFPGVVIPVDDHNDLVPMAMGQGANITINTEQFLLQYAKQRSGVSDYMAGGAGSAGMPYSAATTTVEMLKQGRLKIDQSLRETRKALNGIGRRVLELYAQFNQGGKFRAVLGEADGALVEAYMALPIDALRAGLGISITATDAHLNKETQIRTKQLIYSMVMEFYMQLFQGLQIAVNPQLPPPLTAAAQAMIEGGTTLMRRILETYGEQDADRIIPDLQTLLNNGQTQLAALSPAIGGGAPMGPGGLDPSGLPIAGGGYAGAVGGPAQQPVGLARVA